MKRKSRKEKINEYLKQIYFNPSRASSFGGINKLEQYIKEKGKYKISRKEIQKWLQSQEVHTTNTLPKKKLKVKRRVIVPYINYMFDVDTASMKDYQKDNDGFGYFILAIDIMSRFVWCQPIRSPTGENVREVFQNIFEKGRIPLKIRTDKGTEFSNEIMQKFFKTHNITHFVTQNETKANYAERAIQTIKGKIIKYMRAKQTRQWVNQLVNFTKSYNNTIHRSIKQTPASVTKKDENKLWKQLYLSNPIATPTKKIIYKFEIGDIVRISLLRHPFKRYYSEHWTNELFIIEKRNIKQYIPIYHLTDYAKEEIKGTFYESELQKVHINDNTLYNIEEVIEEKEIDGIKHSLIKWVGWPKKFNSWIPTKDVKSI